MTSSDAAIAQGLYYDVTNYEERITMRKKSPQIYGNYYWSTKCFYLEQWRSKGRQLGARALGRRLRGRISTLFAV